MQGRYLQVIDLLPWGANEILAFLERQSLATTPEQESNIQEFRELIISDRYDQYYGDIPRRPLFLRMIIDDVLSAGIRSRSRVELFDSWITTKLLRDWYSPVQVGGEGRSPIIGRDAGVDEDMRTARRIMRQAARIMVVEADGRLDLTADISVDQLRAGLDPSDTDFNVAALTLSSLLIPIGVPRPGRPLRLSFAHRAFQEFFLAESLLVSTDLPPETILPDAVLSWLQEMRATASS